MKLDETVDKVILCFKKRKKKKGKEKGIWRKQGNKSTAFSCGIFKIKKFKVQLQKCRRTRIATETKPGTIRAEKNVHSGNTIVIMLGNNVSTLRESRRVRLNSLEESFRESFVVSSFIKTSSPVRVQAANS